MVACENRETIKKNKKIKYFSNNVLKSMYVFLKFLS